MSKIRIVLADDHPLIRAGFKSLLGMNEAFEIVGEAETGKELVQITNELNPDVILADITMPEFSGLDALVQIKKDNPYQKFIVLSMHEEREYVLKAIKSGANGYLLKNVERNELENAIKTVEAGGKYFSPFVMGILAESIVKKEDEEYLELTPREKEVLKLVANGMSTKQIADKLDISIRTVESHRINMLKKFKSGNTAELIKKAMDLGIL